MSIKYNNNVLSNINDVCDAFNNYFISVYGDSVFVYIYSNFNTEKSINLNHLHLTVFDIERGIENLDENREP